MIKSDRRWLGTWIKENGYKISEYGTDQRLIILGENHENKMIQRQKELIERFLPEYLLYECIGAATYDPTTRKKDFLEGRPINSIDRSVKIPSYMIGWANKFGSRIIGCDLTMQEIDDAWIEIAKENPEEFVLSEKPWRTTEIYRKHELPFLGESDDEIMPYRIRKNSAVILDYVEKTDRILIAILGCEHISSNSEIHRMLKEGNFGYFCIKQTSKRK